MRAPIFGLRIGWTPWEILASIILYAAALLIVDALVLGIIMRGHRLRSLLAAVVLNIVGCLVVVYATIAAFTVPLAP